MFLKSALFAALLAAFISPTAFAADNTTSGKELRVISYTQDEVDFYDQKDSEEPSVIANASELTKNALVLQIDEETQSVKIEGPYADKWTSMMFVNLNYQPAFGAVCTSTDTHKQSGATRGLGEGCLRE